MIDPALDFALREADDGTPVFPLYPIVRRGDALICRCQVGRDGRCKAVPGKHPQILGWQNLATKDTAQVRACLQSGKLDA